MTGEPLTFIERRVYEICVAAANENRPLDSIEDMTDEIGASSVSTIPGIMRRLERKGWIVRLCYQRGRQVRIVESGRCTLGPKDKTPHWRTDPSRPKPVPAVPPHLLRDRAPSVLPYIHKLMSERNITFTAASIELLLRGIEQMEGDGQ
jgi:SOS-response transcriptional repressor LexA